MGKQLQRHNWCFFYSFVFLLFHLLNITLFFFGYIEKNNYQNLLKIELLKRAESTPISHIC